MKILKIYLPLLFAGLILYSCGSGALTSKDDRKKLKSYNSYAFLPDNDTIMSRNFDNEHIQEVIIETINANMREQGYVLDKTYPDVLIKVHPMFDEKVAVNANPVYTNYPYYRPGFYIGPYYKDYMYDNYFTIQRIDGPRIKQIPYRQGSIVIDFIDRRTNEILWRGTSDKSIGSRRMDRDIRDYIDDIFKDFP
ncbi:DUF4136 domain-containing protein [Christiangramia fulva]|uniref:DUF4136 domain-containing protein n=1 Tax=Christiangramia fulva TaxID=2126553 RepID=A0A2R3Z6E1_9FLAO|nr:DUF4136 domain-containing protein [Christiangramia fulva]AVR45782.1 DUF4136 domain-containing protein [Christiangramia fulva]